MRKRGQGPGLGSRAWGLVLVALALAGCETPVSLDQPPRPQAARPPVPAAPPPGVPFGTAGAPVPPPLGQPAPVAGGVPAPGSPQAVPAAGAPAGAAVLGDDVLRQRLQDIALSASARASLVEFGRSAQGRPLLSLALTARGPADETRPRVFVVAGRHAQDGPSTEAVLALARELAGAGGSALLGAVDLVLVPRLDPDAAAGAAAPARSDHLLLDTPQAAALARWVREQAPLVLLSVSAPATPPAGTPGVAQPVGAAPADLLLRTPALPHLPEFVTRAAEEWLLQPARAAVQGQGLRAGTALPPAAAQPSEAWGGLLAAQALKNVVSAGLEWPVGDAATTARGAQAMRVALHAMLQGVAMRAQDFAKVRRYVDAETSARACRDEQALSLRWAPDAGAAGAAARPAWQAVASRRLPCGYALAAEALPLVQRLRQQGVRVDEVCTPAARLGAITRPGDPALVETVVDLPVGSFYVALDQPLANLIAATLEPGAAGGAVAHGLLPATAVARVQAPLAAADLARAGCPAS